MRTTLRINDALYHQAKVAAAREGVTLTTFIEQALRLRLNASSELSETHESAAKTSDQVQISPSDNTNRADLMDRLQTLFAQADERDKGKEGSAGPFSREELYADRLDRFR